MSLGKQQATLDLMVEFAIADLASGEDERIRSMVRNMAIRWPGEKALAICFALTCAAADLEDAMRGETISTAANRAYKLAALVAADILAIEALKPAPARAEDLLHHWRRVDPYFLTL